MGKEKICHITTVHNAFDTRIFYKECRSLAKYFGRVYLIAPSNENLEIDGIQVIRIPIFKNRFLRITLGNMIAFTKAIKIRSEIYHFHDPEFLPWALLVKLFTKSKVIYDVHEDYFSSINEKKWIGWEIFRKVLATLFNFLEKRIARFFDAIVIAEDYYIENFKEYNKNIVKILNYPIIYEAEAKINPVKNNFCIVYSGTVSENRGIWNALNAVKYFSIDNKDFTFYIIGKFSSLNLLQNVNSFIQENSLEEFVEIIGGAEYVKREIIDSYHKFMDVGLVLIPYSPHYERKLLTKFFEYMAAGIPFIATNFRRWEQFIKENKCGFAVKPDDFKNIAILLQYLFEHPDKRKKMGEEGKKMVLHKYNWRTEENKLINLYKEVLK